VAVLCKCDIMIGFLVENSEIVISEYLLVAVLCKCDIMIGFLVETIPTDGNF